MSQYKSELLRLLEARGYIHQATDAAGLDALAQEQVIPGYIGFDATGPSLHVGSLVQIMMLRRIQQAGHKPIVLMGGGTTKIGDPSGKDESRQLLTNTEIGDNIASIKRVFEHFLVFGDGPTDAIMANNADWLDELDYIPFLREIGTQFTINRMLTFDSVKLRLDREDPMTFLEFNYMILQAYDFLELSRRVGCRLQLGGSDQWGNIVSGIDLGRRSGADQLYGLTTPLITTADGGKMGKTEKGAVWLNAEQLSPYDYWQFWRNTQDGDVGRFLRLFTDVPEGEIARLEALGGAEINEAKKALANAATEMLHGEEAASEASDTAWLTFEEGEIGGALPTLIIPPEGMKAADALAKLGFVNSNKEGRRQIVQGAVKLDGIIVTNELHFIRLDAASSVKISFGRKKHGRLFGSL